MMEGLNCVTLKESLSELLEWCPPCVLSHVQLFETPWTIARQALLSMELSRQGYRSGLPFLSPRDIPESGIEPRSPSLQAD